MAIADGHNEQCTMESVQWKTVKLGDVAKTFTGLTYSPNCIDKSGTLVLRSSNIKDGQLCFEDNVYVSMEIPERAIVQENDILICVRNGSRNLIGKCALITKDAVGMAFGAFMTVLRSNIIDPKLLLYIWQSNIIQRQVANNIGATINQITNADFNRFEISYPDSLPAQRRIAAILSAADKAIEQTRQLIGKYKSIKQGLMEDLLKPKEGWKKDVIVNVCDKITDGCHNKPKCIDRGDYVMLSSQNIKDNQLDLTNVSFLNKDDFEREDLRTRTQSGDILLTIVGTIGRTYLIKESDPKFTLQRSVAVLTPINTVVDASFLLYSLKNSQSILENEAHGCAQKGIYLKQLAQLPVCFPMDLPEQRRIAKMLSGIDRKIEAEHKVLEKYEKMKKGLMEGLLREENMYKSIII